MALTRLGELLAQKEGYLIAVQHIDRHNFGTLVQKYGPELRAYSLRLTGGRVQLADEVLQSAYQVAWTKRAQFRGGNVRAWLYCITRQQGLYRLRAEGRYVEVAPERLQQVVEAGAQVSEPGVDPQRLQQLRHCFSLLQSPDESIVAMAYGLRPMPKDLEGDCRLTYQEIADVLADEVGECFKPDRVRMRLKRALARLLKCMGTIPANVSGRDEL